MGEQLDIKEGEYYRTRDGRKAYVDSIVSPSPFDGHTEEFPVVGFIDNEGSSISWRLDGGYYFSSQEDSFDLVGPWEDPVKVEGWVNVYKSGALANVIFASRQQADLHPSAKGRKACVFISGTEGDCP
jgi:hypothetical protein